MQAYGLLMLVGTTLLLLTTKAGLFLFMNAFHTPVADVCAPWLTILGDGRTAALLPVMLFFVHRPLAWRAALALILTLALVQICKQLIFHDALRPTAYFEAIGSRVNHLIPGVDQHRHQSFPSGHTAAAFAMAALLSFLSPPRPLSALPASTRKVTLLTLALLIGYTRVYLSQHFFEDVVAGSFLGVFSATLMIWVWPLPTDSKEVSWVDGNSGVSTTNG